TLARQGRAAEGLEALAPVLVDVETVAPPVLRLAGELELAAGRPGEALPWLRRALATMPHDARALAAAMAAWQRLGERGDEDAALALARELAARVPGSGAAHAVIVQVLQRRDPADAVAHVAGLLQEATDERARDALEAWLALLEDAAGRCSEAAARWEAIGARRAPSQLPLPPVSLPAEQTAAGPWPEPAQAQADGRVETLFLWGPPGSCVENVATMLSSVRGFRSDRLT